MGRPERFVAEARGNGTGVMGRLVMPAINDPGFTAAAGLGWNWLTAALNGTWPAWVSNVANVLQVATVFVAALAWWSARSSRSRGVAQRDGSAEESGSGWSGTASSVRTRSGGADSSRSRHRLATRLIVVLSIALPRSIRKRFVGEVQGDLGVCTNGWQRIGYMAGIVAGLAGLALTTWRERWRRRA